MSVYINGSGCISPQYSTDGGLFSGKIREKEGDYMKCIDPDYKLYIPPAVARRAGRIIKMSAAAAKICLQDAGVEMPGAIIAGTGMGCIEDTENFLGEIIRNEERMLAPTAFIQSTHNTAGAQIAILLGCNNYNMTYVHRGFSFESALIDSILQLEAGEANNILAGGLDEMTPGMYAISKRLGVYQNSVAGEGAAFFLLDNQKTEGTYCKISAVEMLYKPANEQEISNKINEVLKENSLGIDDINLVISGQNGDSRFDGNYNTVLAPFKKKKIASFKNLCGEYHTASSFALWLSATIFKTGHIPSFLNLPENSSKQPDNLLIYNHYLGTNHSIILLQKC